MKHALSYLSVQRISEKRTETDWSTPGKGFWKIRLETDFYGSPLFERLSKWTLVFNLYKKQVAVVDVYGHAEEAEIK